MGLLFAVSGGLVSAPGGVLRFVGCWSFIPV